jgi:hypothetical protein
MAGQGRSAQGPGRVGRVSAPAAVLLLAVAALLALAGGAAGAERLRLRLPPYAGVACPIANDIRCDRVGLAVWLTRPTARLAATIDGQPVRMRIPAGIRYGPGTSFGARGEYFQGFLHPAGLLNGPLKVHPDAGRYSWMGAHPLRARVHLTAFYAGGATAATTATVWLHPGWG